MTGGDITFLLNFHEETVKSLKHHIHKVVRIEPRKLRLMWEGIGLGDERSLCDYALEDQDTLYLMVQQRGGGGRRLGFCRCQLCGWVLHCTAQ